MNKDLYEYLPFYGTLNDEDRRLVDRTCEKLRFHKGDVVHTKDECSGFIVILDGQLKAQALSEDGREITLFRLFARDVCIFSSSCAMRNIEFDIEVRAEEDSQAILIPSNVMGSIMEHDIAVVKFANDIMQARMSDIMWLVDQILNKKLDQRLAAFLIEESNIRGDSHLEITHEEIARHLGSAREVISRTLGYLQREGEVLLGRGYVEITNREKLEERAELSLR